MSREDGTRSISKARRNVSKLRTMLPESEGPATPAAPAVWKWYVVLCVLLALTNFGLAWLGVFFIQNSDEITARANYPPGLTDFYGMFFIVCGLLFGAGNLALPFLPKRPWIYVLHITNIVAAGLTCCLLPAALPVFIYWLKPETREFFDFR